MDFEGSYLLLAGREDVWRALNDTTILAEVIPGCQNIAWSGPTSLDLTIKIKLGLINPKFGGELELSEIEPAVSYVLSGRGIGGIMGHAHGAARISLNDMDIHALPPASGGEELESFLTSGRQHSGLATALRFKAQGGASGKIMDLGKALVGKSAQRIIDGFFARFASEMDAQIFPLVLPDQSHEPHEAANASHS